MSRRGVCLLVLAVVAAPACQDRPRPAPVAPATDAASARASDAAAFWAYVRTHAAEISGLESADGPAADRLADALHRFDPKLTFELGPKGDARELVISADGIRTRFPQVQALVAAAPAIPGLRVVAFRQRKALDLRFSLGGAGDAPAIDLGADDLWFTAARGGDDAHLVALQIAARGLTPENKHAVFQAVFLLLDAALGEYDVETRIGAIDLVPAPADPAQAGLRPLRDLPAVVDHWR